MIINSTFRPLIAYVLGLCAWSGSFVANAQQIPTPYVAADTISSKVFNLQGHCGPTATWLYNRTPVGTDVLVSRTQIRTDSFGANCRYQIADFLSTPTDYSQLKMDKYSDDGSTLISSYEWDRPIPVLLSSMADRLTFGEAASSISTPGHIVITRTFLGVENVTVAAGTFNSCLKIHTLRVSNSGGDVSRISWRCPDVGMVKQIQGHTTDGKMQVWELQQIN